MGDQLKYHIEKQSIIMDAQPINVENTNIGEDQANPIQPEQVQSEIAAQETSACGIAAPETAACETAGIPCEASCQPCDVQQSCGPVYQSCEPTYACPPMNCPPVNCGPCYETKTVTCYKMEPYQTQVPCKKMVCVDKEIDCFEYKNVQKCVPYKKNQMITVDQEYWKCVPEKVPTTRAEYKCVAVDSTKTVKACRKVPDKKTIKVQKMVDDKRMVTKHKLVPYQVEETFKNAFWSTKKLIVSNTRLTTRKFLAKNTSNRNT